MPDYPIDADLQPNEPLPSEEEATDTSPTRLARSDQTADLLPPPEPDRVPPLQLQGTRGSQLVGVREKRRYPWPSIAGYEILGELGCGGMGVVFQARQISLDRIVALKMIRSGDLASPQEVARFCSEAETLARLKHPNIVHIHEVGEQNGRPYFCLEYVEGGSLDQKIKGTPQPPRLASELVETLARAVQAAHQRGVIHRDLKPSNVLLTSDGMPKILDFGLAKRLDHEATQTQTGAVMGTPSYMAPEQAAGKTKEIGPAADIYSLGAILYKLVTGRPPFLAESWEETRNLVLSREPVAPRRLQPKLPRDLQTICLKCLEKDPYKRFANALDLADELKRYLDGKPIQSRPIGIAERIWRWARRKPAVATCLVLVFVAAIATAGLWYWGEQNRRGRVRAEREREEVQQFVKGLSPQQQEVLKRFAAWFEKRPQLATLSLEEALALYKQDHPDARGLDQKVPPEIQGIPAERFVALGGEDVQLSAPNMIGN